MYVMKLFILITVAELNYGEGQISLDGQQYITNSLITNPLHRQRNDLGINFCTTLSSCLLFLASGVSGDYIALELIRGKLRFVANSDGITENPPLEIIYGDNYADGNYHQVNIEIGEFTKIYTYTFPFGAANQTKIRSNAKDLRFDLDEVSYYAGMPEKERASTKNILLSSSNFIGCLDVIAFNGNIDISESSFVGNPGLSFHGRYLKGCQLNQPTFLKSFTKQTEILRVSPKVNDRTFIIEFLYKTYLQDGVILASVSNRARSSILLLLRDNKLKLTVNLTDTLSVQITHHEKFSDDGVWRKIKIQVVADSISFFIGEHSVVRTLNRTLALSFPKDLRFGGYHESTPGFVGCIKDIFFGKTPVSINKIMNLDINMNFEEKMCQMNDLCFPSGPCKNLGKCTQDVSQSQCHCSGTGYTGPTCEEADVDNYHKSCDAYYRAGYIDDGIYTIKPGSSPPFNVKCEMNNPNGPTTFIETNLKNETSVLTGSEFDKDFYYHQVSYQASKRQINDLIAASNSCQQYVRYNCYQSTLLNSKSRQRQPSKLGVRWYTRLGSLRNYWGGSINNSNSCKCAVNRECVQENLSCNCDIYDAKMRFDDGYMKDVNDLPISKIRISRLMTNHRSSFQIGSLECRQNFSAIHSYGKKIARVTSRKMAFTSLAPPVAKRRPVSTPHNMAVDSAMDHGNGDNTTVNRHKERATKFIVLDSKLLYVIIAIMIALIIMCMLLLLFRRHVCCCYHENRAKPQIIELYKEEINRNNNTNILQVSNDVTVKVDDLVLPFSRSTYTNQSSSDSSASTIDLERYYSPEKYEKESESDKKSNDSPPRRSILKIKKDNSHRYKQKRDKTMSHGSDESSTSITRTTQHPPAYRTNLDAYSDKDFNYDIDNREKCPAISPLKQKVLALSTKSKQPATRNPLFYNRDSLSSIRTSSCSSTNDSDTLCENEEKGERNCNIELIPISRSERSKSVRFTDEECEAVHRHYKSKNSILTVDLDETESFLYDEESNKTLV